MPYSRLKNILSASAALAVFAVTTASADTAVSVDGEEVRQVVQEQEQLRNAERKQLRTHKMTGEGYSSSAQKIREREQKREQKRIHAQSRKGSENGQGGFQRGGFGPQSAGRGMGSGGGKGGRR